jgi:uncharacterized protein (TIGR02594 family)
MSICPWIDRAYGFLGTREGVGSKDNPVVLAMYRDVGHADAKHDAIPWCAAFVGAMLEREGIKSTKTLWALDYLQWGHSLGAPYVGAVGVKKREGGGHVFFVVGYDETWVYALGGNQSDAVCVTKILRAAVTSYRWPVSVALPDKATRPAHVFPAAPARAAGKEA